MNNKEPLIVDMIISDPLEERENKTYRDNNKKSNALKRSIELNNMVENEMLSKSKKAYTTNNSKIDIGKK